MSRTVYNRAERLRAEVLTGERAARAEMRRSWAIVRRSLSADIDRLVDKTAGRDLTIGEITRLDHYLRFHERATAEISSFSTPAQRRIVSLSSWAADSGASAAGELMELSAAQVGATMTLANAEAVIAMTGRIRAGRAVHAMSTVPARAVARIERELVAGIAAGRNPREIARRMRAGADMSLYDAERIARNEVMSAYRMAQTQTYRANAAALSGWRWQAALDDRTCAVCWAWDGTITAVGHNFDTHVGCRCSPVPIPLGYEDLLDFGPTGPERFDRLTMTEQVRILGPGRHELYRAGVGLKAMTATTTHPTWGNGRILLPLKAMAA